MFERILEHTTPLGLPRDRARQLLGMLVAQIFNPRRGGPAGFLHRLRAAGLERETASWLGPGENLPASATGVAEALGPEALAHMSEKLELPASAVLAASTAMLPDAIHELSEHGDLPETAEHIPAGFSGWFGNLHEFLDEFGHWSMATANASAAALGASVGVVGEPASAHDTAHATSPAPTVPGNRRPVWLAVLVALALVVATLSYCSRESRPAAAPGAHVTQAASGHTV